MSGPSPPAAHGLSEETVMMSIWDKGVLGALKLSGLTAGRSPSGCRSGESLMGQGQVSFL